MRTTIVRPRSVTYTSAFGLNEQRRAWLVIGRLSSANKRSNSRKRSSVYMGFLGFLFVSGTSMIRRCPVDFPGLRRRQVAAVQERFAVKIEEPRGPFFPAQVAFHGETLFDEPREHVADDVAMAADDRRLFRTLGKILEDVVAVAAFDERVRSLHGEAALLGKRLDRIGTAQVRARKDAGDRKGREPFDQRLGLAPPSLGKRPKIVGTFEGSAAARFRVPHQVDRAGRPAAHGHSSLSAAR